MDCPQFDQRLDQLLDGSCAPDRWALAATHADGCARCRRLLDAVTGGLSEMDAGASAALTGAVLARTSGATCVSARDRLCGYVDGAIGPVDRELVGGHLAGCPACRSLAAALADASAALPGFAEFEPGPGFTARVVGRTTLRPAVPGLPARVAAWWQRAVTRPRFPFEVAYVLTLVLMIAVGDPVAAFRETSARAAAIARPGVERAVSSVVEPMAEAGSDGIGRVRSAAASVASLGSTAAGAGGAGKQSALRRWFTVVFGRSFDALFDRLGETASAVRQVWGAYRASGARGQATAQPVPAPRGRGGRAEPGGAPAR